MTVIQAKATLACLSDPKCQERFATKGAMVPHENNYPLSFDSLTSHVRSTPEGGLRVDLQIVVTNATREPFGRFQMLVSPGVLRQGQPIRPPELLIVDVESLDAGATGVFVVEGVMLPGPEGGKFGCLDPSFSPGT